MGNPIIKNDCIGIKIGERLENEPSIYENIDIFEFVGSPLDLASQFSGYKGVILLDSIITGRLDIGSVVILKEEELLPYSQNLYYIHGINLPEALMLNKRLGIPLPAQMLFIGIEIGRADEFGEALSNELEGKLDTIYSTVFVAITQFLHMKSKI